VRLARPLHPGAWWLWALGLATAASRTSQPLLLALVLAVTGYVVAARRTDAPWARTYRSSLLLGGVILGIRLVFDVVFGTDAGTTILVRLPDVPLPHWMAGVVIGGPVSAEGLVAALEDGLRVVAVLACIGAAASLASPARMLASLPAALYEVGLTVVVALSLAPQAVADVQRVRSARRLRGRPTRGLAALRSTGLPVLEDALERSVQLAASMDARGYGRRAHLTPAVRRTTAVCTLGGLLGVTAGTYGLLDAGSPSWLGLPALLGGVVVAVVGLGLGGRRAVRSRYRPDPWRQPEWITAGAGAVAAVVLVAVSLHDPVALQGFSGTLAWPTLPLLPALAILVGLAPAWLTPHPTQLLDVWRSPTRQTSNNSADTTGVAA
jgi:energy-coupling factor transport system permease protein